MGLGPPPGHPGRRGLSARVVLLGRQRDSSSLDPSSQPLGQVHPSALSSLRVQRAEGILKLERRLLSPLGLANRWDSTKAPHLVLTVRAGPQEAWPDEHSQQCGVLACLERCVVEASTPQLLVSWALRPQADEQLLRRHPPRPCAQAQPPSQVTSAAYQALLSQPRLSQHSPQTEPKRLPPQGHYLALGQHKMLPSAPLGLWEGRPILRFCPRTCWTPNP